MKFFRKIRFLFLSESRTSKYLLYAAGEIVLVVIGILIAIQINKWKIASDNRKLGETLLIDIRKNLMDDIQNLEEVLQFKTRQKESCARLLGLIIDTAAPVEDTGRFCTDLVSMIYFILPNLNKTAFETAKSTGRLHLIGDNTLTYSLDAYFSGIILDQHVTETKRFTNNFVESVLMKKYRVFYRNSIAMDGMGANLPLEAYRHDSRPMMLPIDGFRRDFEMENNLASFSIRLFIGTDYIRQKIDDAQQLIDRINSYLSDH